MLQSPVLTQVYLHFTSHSHTLLNMNTSKWTLRFYVVQYCIFSITSFYHSIPLLSSHASCTYRVITSEAARCLLSNKCTMLSLLLLLSSTLSSIFFFFLFSSLFFLFSSFYYFFFLFSFTSSFYFFLKIFFFYFYFYLNFYCCVQGS